MESTSSSEDRQEVVTSSVRVRPLTHATKSADVGALYVYGVFRSRQHDYAEAERLLRRALAIQVSQFGDDHPSIADTRSALGEALTERGQFSEAETMLSRAHEVMSKTYGAAAPETKEVSAALDKLHDRMKQGNGRG